jgi:4-hydroxybenzoate polyprenyltransferase
MDSPEAAKRWADAPPSLTAEALPVEVLPIPSRVVLALVWAGIASTTHRIRRGEGALLAVNLSLIAYQGWDFPRAFVGAVVSALTMIAMYAFNDLYDAPTDLNNPKKDRALISMYLEYRRVCAVALFVLKLAIVALAFVTLGMASTVAVIAAMLVNIVYSTLLKGAPVLDVAWCGVWGACYAAIVTASPLLLVVVGLMTAVCHLYQALDDRVSDAANAIITTAVRSRALSRNVLIALSLLLFLALRAPLGAWALTAFIPLGIFFACREARIGWLLTKVYFGAVWLAVLEIVRASS